jgi:hypothetical protein
MSYSSLVVITSDYYGKEKEIFRNSWLFSPIIWDVLAEKYIPYEELFKYGFKRNLIHDRKLFKELNNIINGCQDTPDRILWELSNQQIFFTKDKDFIEECIYAFLKQNENYCTDYDSENHIAVLKIKHILERFCDIAHHIKSLEAEETPYFVFKNTSVDDSVSNWFSCFNENTGKWEYSKLSENKKFCAEFVVIEDNKIKKFISNLDYKY